MTLIKAIFSVIKTIIIALLLICLIIFMVNNRADMTINLFPLPFVIETKAFLVIIITFIFGMLFGFLLFSKKLIQNAFGSLKDSYKIKKLETKLALKNIRHPDK